MTWLYEPPELVYTDTVPPPPTTNNDPTLEREKLLANDGFVLSDTVCTNAYDAELYCINDTEGVEDDVYPANANMLPLAAKPFGRNVVRKVLSTKEPVNT